MKHSGLALLCLVASWTCPALAEINYSKTVELPPLRISFAELQTVLDKGASLMRAANESIPLWREEMDLRKGELRVEMSGHRLDQERARIPQTLDRLEYTASTRDAAPVSRLNLSFADYSRTLSVQGQSPDQVDAVFSAMRDELSKLSTPIGGPGFKFLRFLSISILAWALLALGSSWAQTRRRFFLLPISLVVALLVALIVLPIGELFAGFAVVRGDASFMVRYGPEISFWGLVVGAVAIALSLIPLLGPTGAKTE